MAASTTRLAYSTVANDKNAGNNACVAIAVVERRGEDAGPVGTPHYEGGA